MLIKSVEENIKMMKFGGAWKSKSKIKTILYRIYGAFNVSLHSYSICACITTAVTAKNLSLETFSMCLFAMCLSTITVSRILYCTYYHEDIKDILYQLGKGFVMKHSISKEEQELILTADRLNKKFADFSIISSYIGTTFFNAAPALEKLFRWLNSSTEPTGRKYPFPISVPFNDDNNTAVYIGFYLFCNVASFSLLNIWVGTDVFFYGVITHICHHYKILGNRVRNIKYDLMLKGPVNFDEDKKKNDLLEEIRNACVYHNDLIEFCVKFESMFNVQLFQVLVSVTSLFCCCGFQLAIGSRNNATHYSAMVTAIFNISSSWFISCLFGSWINSESKKFADDLYLGEWTTFPKEHRRLWTFMLARAQKPIIFKAGFFLITLGSFVDMAKLAYSFVAIMRQTYNSKD